MKNSKKLYTQYTPLKIEDLSIFRKIIKKKEKNCRVKIFSPALFEQFLEKKNYI